jgi:hypothetical protein
MGDPEQMIEKIIAKIFNNASTIKYKEDKYLSTYRKKINILCAKHENNSIISLLLTKIRDYNKRILGKTFGKRTLGFCWICGIILQKKFS